MKVPLPPNQKGPFLQGLRLFLLSLGPEEKEPQIIVYGLYIIPYVIYQT
jgi:hypothetical protein